MTIRPLVAVLVTFLATGCANPINQRTAENYYAAGERAVAAGNLPLAKQSFSRALINTQIGHLGPAAESQAARKLAQILGNMCEYEDAEKTFLLAIAVEENAYGSTSPRTFPTRLELAQFNFDVGRFDRATAYYEKAFAVGGPILEAGDPLSYARLLDDYALALASVGNAKAANDANTKAASMRDRAKGPSAGVVKLPSEYVPYPKSCARQ
jgi:tetratricopeptide (TPR) repeat protein